MQNKWLNRWANQSVSQSICHADSHSVGQMVSESVSQSESISPSVSQSESVNQCTTLSTYLLSVRQSPKSAIFSFLIQCLMSGWATCISVSLLSVCLCALVLSLFTKFSLAHFKSEQKKDKTDQILGGHLQHESFSILHHWCLCIVNLQEI